METISTIYYSIMVTLLSDFKYVAAFLSSFLVTYVVIPYIIKIARENNYIDKPDARKVHKNSIPTLGGFGIFVGVFAASLLWISYFLNLDFIYLLASTVILLITGIIDDLKGMNASKKFSFQFLAALIITIGGFRITTFNGLFGIYELPIMAQYILTILIIVGVTNAFNLIDGIDGLAGGIGFINAFVLGFIFIASKNIPFAILSFALAGGLIAFLRYNFNPAKIFMGDTGSLVIGFLLVVMGIKAIQINVTSTGLITPNIIVLVSSILFFPVFDTIRVFIIRVVNRRSPFSADRNHIHHLLINKGYNHKKAAIILYISNILIIVCGYLIQDIRPGIFNDVLLLFKF